jgi:phosphotriesterase-related protein
MQRRTFLKTIAAASTFSHSNCYSANRQRDAEVMTVDGPISPDKLGVTLPHEHIMVDFVGADKVSRDRYDQEKVYHAVLPHLKQVAAAGCKTFIDCTPAYLARDPVLLRRLSRASGLQIVTNTGYYTAAGGKFLPAHASQESADQLAQRWLAEWTDGIEGTGIRPGFMKIGVDQGPLNDVSKKLVRAAARAHLKSGLTIACHTGNGAAALEEMEILRAEGVDPSAWIWVHAQSERDAAIHERAAERGGWVEFDGVSPDSIDRHVELVQNMKRRGLLGRVLISHDAGWYSVGEPNGGKFRPFTALFEQFLPALVKAGFDDDEIRGLTVKNPAEAFTIRVRAVRT